MTSPPASVSIRELRAGQSAELLSTFGAVLSDFASKLVDDGRSTEDFLHDPQTFALVAHLDDEPAGLAWGVQLRYPTGRLVTYLHELDVVERFRRRGVATALVRHAMDLARERGSTRFWLSTGGHNEGAQALYESLDGVRKPQGDVNYWWELA